jgi:hypothetical protein
MRDKDNVSEALALRIVKNAERNAIDTLQTQQGMGIRLDGFEGPVDTHVVSPGVQRRPKSLYRYRS